MTSIGVIIVGVICLLSDKYFQVVEAYAYSIIVFASIVFLLSFLGFVGTIRGSSKLLRIVRMNEYMFYFLLVYNFNGADYCC